MNYHVLPVKDLKEHIEETTCECHPKVVFESGNMIIVHNSYDGREYREQLIAEIERQFMQKEFDDMIGSDDI